MRLAFVAALVGSLALHLAALFGTHVNLIFDEPEPLVIKAELKPLPSAPAAPPAAPEKPHPKPIGRPAAASAPLTQAVPAEVAAKTPVVAETEALPEKAPVAASTVNPPPAPVKPILPVRGVIRYSVSMGTQGFQVGRAEHRWEFAEDGSYRLRGVTETSGLASLFKSLRFENESVGHLTARGLQPDTYRTVKNGRDGNENADFDWSTASVHLARDGSVRSIVAGTQDILSLNYQLAYLPAPEAGASVGVVTGKKYERYALDSLGEEMLDTPVGRLRTLHLRATTESITEIWIALDRYRLPVKIRFTDKKGDSLEQLVTEIGALAD